MKTTHLTSISKQLTLLFAMLMMLVSLSSSAQNITATASLSNANIKIGQQIKLSLSINYNANTGKHISITWPQFTDTIIKQIEIVSQSKIDTIIADSSNPYQLTQRKTVIITSFDSGSWVVPPLKFLANTDTNGFFTQPLTLNVSNVAVDTTMAIHDIKPIFKVSYTLIDWIKDNVYELLIGLVAIIIIIIIIYFVRKKLKNKPIEVIPEKPKLPAHIIALEKLNTLKVQKLWQEDKTKLYYSTLTDIVREYIENRYNIQALEQTTEEILIGFRNIAIDEESKNKLKQILLLSDLVKFAKENPLPSENEMSLNNGYDFINGTKKDDSPSSSSIPL